MGENKLTLEKVLEDAGLIAKWRTEGREEGLEKTARNALAKGYPLETIHDITGLDIEVIERIASNEKLSSD